MQPPEQRRGFVGAEQLLQHIELLTTLHQQQQQQYSEMVAPPPTLTRPEGMESIGGGGFRATTRSQRIQRVLKILRQKIPNPVLNVKDDLLRHGGLSLLSKLTSSEHIFAKITRKRDEKQLIKEGDGEPEQEEFVDEEDHQDMERVFEDDRDQDLYLQLRHRKVSQRAAGYKRPQHVVISSLEQLFHRSENRLHESVKSAMGGSSELEELFEKMATANLDRVKEEAYQRALTGQDMGNELKERVKKLLRLSLQRALSSISRRVEGLDMQRRSLLREMTKAVAPYYPSQWFELLRFWLLLEYQSSLENEPKANTTYIYLQKAVLHEIEITVQEPWFPGERLKDSWVQFLRSIPKANVTVISHIQRVSEAAQEKGLTLLGAKLVLSLFHQYNSMLATQVEKFAEDRLDEVLGLAGQQSFRTDQMDDLDQAEKQFYVSLYFKLCESKRELLIKILFYFQRLPNEALDVVRLELAHFLIAPASPEEKKEEEKKEDPKKRKKTKSSTQALVTSRSREIETLLGRISSLQGEALVRKKKVVLLLAERFAKQEENISSAFSAAVLNMARKLEMPSLAVPIFHCIEFDKVSANNFFEKALTSVCGYDGKPQNLAKAIRFLQRLLTARTSQEERCEIFKSIVDLERSEIGKNVQILIGMYDSIIRPEYLKVAYIAKVLKSVLTRKYEPPPMLTLFILNKVKENFQSPDDAIENVLRKLLDRKVWEHPNLWGNFKLLIKDYPSSFLKLMKEVPHGTRQLFYDEYPRLKASDRDRKDPKSKPRYPYKK